MVIFHGFGIILKKQILKICVENMCCPFVVFGTKWYQVSGSRSLGGMYEHNIVCKTAMHTNVTCSGVYFLNAELPTRVGTVSYVQCIYTDGFSHKPGDTVFCCLILQ